MGRKILESFKSVLIVLLAAAILVLTVLALPVKTLQQTPWLARLVKPFASFVGMSEAELTYTAAGTAALPGAAQPLLISVMQETGRQSFQYDFSALDGAFEQYGSALGQALDSADVPEPSTREEFLRVLGGTGVVFCYPLKLSPALAAAWLGVQAPQLQTPAQWYLLAPEGETVRLYLMGEEVFSVATRLPAQQLETLMQSTVPDGSFFVFEDTSGKYTRLDGLSLIQLRMPQILTASAQNPCEARFISSMAALLGFNPYGDARFVDSEGTTSFSEPGSTLSVTAQGLVTLRCDAAQPRYEAASSAQDARVETARALLSQIAAQTADARLYLCGYEERGDETVCSFSYYLSGARVSQNGKTAEVRFTGNTVTQVQIRLRSSTLTNQSVYLLPPAQAAAIVRRGGALEVLYADTGEAELQVNWKA